MYRIHRSVDINFAHHVRGHSGACVNIHGHTWKLEVCAQASSLDAEGFVVDFSRLSKGVLLPCHALLDHALALGEQTWASVGAELVPVGRALTGSRREVHGDAAAPLDETPLELHGARTVYPGGMKVALFPFNPTSERLAEWLYGLAAARLQDDRVTIAWARVYETLHPVESVAEFAPA